MGESSDTPENISTTFQDKHFRKTMDSLGQKRLDQGIYPNLKHLYLEATDQAEKDIDPTTGMLNRQAYEQREEELVKLAQRQGIRLVFARFDVNKLKPINDEHGHAAGDKLLSEAGKTILESIRETDPAGRVGGDEFKITFVGIGLKEAEEIIKQRMMPKFNERDVSVSIGIADVDTSSSENVRESDELADTAQSLAKIASRQSDQSEVRTTEDLSPEDIMNRESLKKSAERKAA